MSSRPEYEHEAIPASGLQLGDDERAAVERVLKSGMLAQGPEVAAFESEFAETVDGRPCVTGEARNPRKLMSLAPCDR